MSYRAIPVLFGGYRLLYELIANIGRITCCHFGHEILSYSHAGWNTLIGQKLDIEIYLYI